MKELASHTDQLVSAAGGGIAGSVARLAISLSSSL
jgi:hypothetical protein